MRFLASLPARPQARRLGVLRFTKELRRDVACYVSNQCEDCNLNPKTTMRRGLLVSFSGVDGSGKSTQIEHLRRCLSAQGYSLKLLAFWDDVVVFCQPPGKLCSQSVQKRARYRSPRQARGAAR